MSKTSRFAALRKLQLDGAKQQRAEARAAGQKKVPLNVPPLDIEAIRETGKKLTLAMAYGGGRSGMSALLDLRAYAYMASGGEQGYTRFRSFAERWLIERCSAFRADHMAEDTWHCIQDAKRAYKMIEQTDPVIAP